MFVGTFSKYCTLQHSEQGQTRLTCLVQVRGPADGQRLRLGGESVRLHRLLLPLVILLDPASSHVMVVTQIFRCEDFYQEYIYFLSVHMSVSLKSHR